MGRRVGCSIFVVLVLLGVCGASWGQNKASEPVPADGALDVIQPLLQWTKGATAVFHNVYLGTDPDLGPDDLVAPNHVMVMYWHIFGVVPGTTYYWRVDEVESDMVTVHTGDVWTFTAQPLTAFHPDPADGSTAAVLAPTLTWLPGQGIKKHQVYFSDSFADVNDAAAAADKGVLEELQFAAGDLVPLTTYFWRVDEITVNSGVLAGEVWSFTTIRLVDDFESYVDEIEGRIFQTWIDGWGYTEPAPVEGNGTGATVGYMEAPFAEQTVIHGGLQSMPFDYNNTISPYYSEAERTWATGQNWTAGGVDTLTLHVRSGGADFVIPSVSTPPVIDGEVDEIWAVASVQKILTTISGTAPDTPAGASGQFRVVYDAQNLYAVVDVNDDILINDTANSWQDDSVELYVDGDNTKKGAGLVDNNRQYTFGWTTDDIQGTNINVEGFEHAQVDTETGWRIEIKLPWQSLMGSGAPVGKLIGIDCFYNDDDDGTDTREAQIAWHSTAGADWEIPASWGTALVAAPTVAEGADLLYIVLQDSSNGTGVVTNPDPEIVKSTSWMAWQIALSDFADQGVNLAAIRKMFVGVGDRDNPVPGDAGMLFIDDIYLTVPELAE